MCGYYLCLLSLLLGLPNFLYAKQQQQKKKKNSSLSSHVTHITLGLVGEMEPRQS